MGRHYAQARPVRQPGIVEESNVNESIGRVAPDAWLPAIAQSDRLQG